MARRFRERPSPAALAVEIILIPERRFFLRARRLHRPRDVLDVVRIGRDEGCDALRPQRRDDAAGPAAPIVTAEHRALDPERVHQRQEVRAERRLLAGARRARGQEPRRPVAAQIGNDDPRPGFGEERRRFGVGVDVVWEAVAENARPAGRGSIFQIGDGKNAGVDCLDRCRHVSSAPSQGRVQFERCACAFSVSHLTPPPTFSRAWPVSNSRRCGVSHLIVSFGAGERADIRSASVRWRLPEGPF